MPYQTLKANKDIKIFVKDLSEVDSLALTQLRETSTLPWVKGVAAMSDVHAGKGSSVLDEIPGAYKDIDEVVDNQKELVDIVTVLKQIVCVKG